MTFFLIFSLLYSMLFGTIKVAVLSENVEENERDILVSILERWLLKNGFTVLTRDHLKYLFDEKKGVSYGVFKGGEDEGKVGELLGADLLIVLSSFTRFGYGEGVIVKVLNVRDGRILFVEKKALFSSSRDMEVEGFFMRFAEKLKDTIVKDEKGVNMRSFILKRMDSQSAGPLRYDVEILRDGYFSVFVKEDEHHFKRIFSRYVKPSRFEFILNPSYFGRKFLFILTNRIPDEVLDFQDVVEEFERGAYVCESAF